MAAHPKRIDFDAFARDPARLLDALNEDQPAILIERMGRIYRIERETMPAGEDLWDGYDPEHVRAAITETAGSWSAEDAGPVIDRIYQAREKGSRPASRP